MERDTEGRTEGQKWDDAISKRKARGEGIDGHDNSNMLQQDGPPPSLDKAKGVMGLAMLIKLIVPH